MAVQKPATLTGKIVMRELTVGALRELLRTVPDEVRIAVKGPDNKVVWATVVDLLHSSDRVTIGTPAAVAPAAVRPPATTAAAA